MTPHGRVLIVAGSDSGGGAGIQADIKTVSALGGFATTALTALTAQNTLGVHGIHPVPPAFIDQQMTVVLEDIGADALKTGMLHDAAVIEIVAENIMRNAKNVPYVLDPVMVSQSGHTLLESSAIAALRDSLLPLASIITPNLPEAEALLGRAIEGLDAAEDAAARLSRDTGSAVLLKGGHRAGDDVVDILCEAGRCRRIVYPRVATNSNHGTGCTLASAIATGLAQGLAMADAVNRARAFLQRALETAPSIGHGSGPVNHLHTVCPFDAP